VFGIKDLKKHAEIHMNIYETFSNIDQVNFADLIPFIVLFTLLYCLMRFLPGKPWMLVVACIGIIWGVIVKEGELDSVKCLLLSDLYPTLGVAG